MAKTKEPQTVEEKLDTILAQQEQILEQQEEIVEKLNNLGYSGLASGYLSDNLEEI